MSKKKAIKSLSFLWLGSLLGSGSTFVIYMILARELGVEKFGVFSSALATVTVLSLLAGFGVSQSWLKHFGKEGWDALRWLPSSFKLIFISILFILTLLFTWAYFGPHDKITQHILLIMSFFVVGQILIELVSVKLQLEEKYPKLALWQLLPNFSRLVIIALVIYLFTSEPINVSDIAYIYAFIASIFILIGIYQLYLMNGTAFELQGHGKKLQNDLVYPNIKEVISHSWAFGLGSFFAFIYVQSDIIMVKYISGNEQAGLYNVGFILLTAIYLFPNALYQKFLLPKFHRWANQDRKKFYTTYKQGNKVMLLLGICITIFILAFSDFIIRLFFGKEYIESIIIVNILILTVPFYLVAFSVASTLVTKNNMKRKVKYMGITAILNILLNIILINYFNAIGAAIATVISNAILLIMYIYAANKYVFRDKKELNAKTNS